MAASGFDHLGLDERRSLFRLKEARVPVAEIASRLGRHRSRIYRELARNQTDTLSQDRYRAGLAGIGELLRMLAMSITLNSPACHAA